MDTEALYEEGWTRDGHQILAAHHILTAQFADGGTALDLGCSDGLFLRMLAERGVRAKGIDISPYIVGKARNEGFDAEVGDITKPLAFADNSFDYVSALNVVEHLFDPEAFIKEMSRVASCAVIIATPNFASLPARLQVLRGKVPENNTLRKHHVVWVTWKVLNGMLQRNGLRVVETRNNTFWENKPVLGSCMRYLAQAWPSLFALSFNIKAEKI